LLWYVGFLRASAVVIAAGDPFWKNVAPDGRSDGV